MLRIFFMPQNEPEHIYSVSELTRDIRTLLESNFGRVWVCGEVSNCRRHTSGHVYFTLKDEQSQVSIVLFRREAMRLRFKLEDGLQINVEGRISVYERRGNYQLIASTAEPVGYGALQLAFEQLKQRLGEEGLFDEEHKKPLPRYPQRIGVVTSATGAAIRDILNVIDRRFSSVEVLLFPSLVQGEGAAEQIAGGIRMLDTKGKVDVIIAGRGGGSLEDLWPFNEEIVARAIFECETPVVSAVGHEIDFTIADFVADLRAPTPSAAAELVVREREAIVSEIAQLRESLVRSVEACLTRLEHRLTLAASSYGFRWPADMLVQREQQLDDMRERMLELQERCIEDYQARVGNARVRLLAARPDRAIASLRERLASMRLMLAERAGGALARREAAFSALVAKLDSLSPLAVLARGYSIAYHAGKILKDTVGVSTGDQVNIQLHKGSLVCAVEKVED
jgi:exodeoxyribonuclease VII large subunit